LKKYQFLSIALVAVFGFSLPSLAEAFSTPTGEVQVRVCVNNETKLVRYFNKREKCPANSRELLLNQQGRPGADGSNGSAGANGNDIYRNCFQKREAAISAGAILASKRDREFFERQTGCVVEDIKDEEFISVLLGAGLPVITDWELVSVDIIRAGGGAYIRDTFLGGSGTYRVTIGNYDVLSYGGGQYTFCYAATYGDSTNSWTRSFSLFTQIENEIFEIQAPISSRVTELVTPMTLGIADGRNCTILVVPKTGPFKIHVDPITEIDGLTLSEIDDEYLWPGWGW
jgi:hypothetical protein